MNEVPTLLEVVRMLASGAGTVVFGAALAFLAEKFGWFQNMSANAKWALVLLLSVGTPVAATALLQFVPADVWAALEPYWYAIASGFAVWVSSQVTHKKVNKPAE